MPHIAKQGGRIVRIKDPAAPRQLPFLRSAEMPRDDLEDDATIKGIEYSGTALAGRIAEAVGIEQCRFENARFTGTELRQSVLSDSVFKTCDFAQVRARDVSLIRCTVTSSRITGSSWSSGSFRDVRFESSRSDLALYRYSKFSAVVFSDCNLQGADFQRAELRGVQFQNCDLTGAQFANVEMTNVRFENCTLIDIGGAASLKGVTVQGPGAMELALSLAREAGIVIEP